MYTVAEFGYSVGSALNGYMNVSDNAVIVSVSNYRSLKQASYKETELNGAELSSVLLQ
jgi:hypothetical protein